MSNILLLAHLVTKLTLQTGDKKVNNESATINHHLSHVNASFWLAIQLSNNRHQNLVTDKTGTRSA